MSNPVHSLTPSNQISSIEDIIEDIRQGRPVIMVDDEGRENEGDIIIAAEHATPEAVNFMARFGRGLICLAMSPEFIDRLELPLMATPDDPFKTAFTVSIDAREKTSTGISAFDRSRTIQCAVEDQVTHKDFVTPGHIFPLRGKPQGVLERTGHTEASIDLARLAGLKPAAAICEIMKDDGYMARLPDLCVFAQTHGLKIGTIEDLIAYRKKHNV